MRSCTPIPRIENSGVFTGGGEKNCLKPAETRTVDMTSLWMVLRLAPILPRNQTGIYDMYFADFPMSPNR